MARPAKKTVLEKALENLPLEQRTGRKTILKPVSYDFNKHKYYVYLGSSGGKKYLTFDTAQETEKFLKDKELLEAKTGKSISETCTITLLEYMEDYHKYKSYKTETTKKFYDVIINRIKQYSIINKPIINITKHDLNVFFEEELLEYAPSTVKKDYTFLKTIFTQAFDEGILLINCMRLISPIVVPETKPKSYKIEQAQQIIEFCLKNLYKKDTRVGETTHNYCVRTALISLLTGCRREEVLGLKHHNVFLNTDKPYILITDARTNVKDVNENTKTSASVRKIPLCSILVDLFKLLKAEYERDKARLKDQFNDAGYVICYENGNPVSASAVSNYFKKELAECGLPEEDLCGYHIMRKTFCTLAFKNNVESYNIQLLAGHANFSTTEKHYIDKQVPLPDVDINKIFNLAI